MVDANVATLAAVRKEFDGSPQLGYALAQAPENGRFLMVASEGIGDHVETVPAYIHATPDDAFANHSWEQGIPEYLIDLAAPPATAVVAIGITLSVGDRTELQATLSEACDCPDGWLWPMASDGDETYPFVERCDDCQVFGDDIIAANALAATIDGGHVVMRPVHGDPNRLQPAVYPCEGWTE